MAELPALIQAFDTSRGRVTRLTAHRDTWTQACDLPVAGRTVKAAWLTSGFDPHTIRLFSYGVGHWDQLVVPPAADPALLAEEDGSSSAPGA